ncbi:hypothetical protein BB560_006928, partial [Smittium megazygosporum]
HYLEKLPIKLNYILENRFPNTANFYSSNPFTLNGCSSGCFYLTFNVNYTAVEPNFLSVALANGTKGITSDPTIDYRFYPNSICYILYKSGGRSNCSPTTSSASSAAGKTVNANYSILHNKKGSKLGANGLTITYLNSTSALNKIVFVKGTKSYLVDEARRSANIHNITDKCLTTDTCLTVPQAPYSSPSSDGGGDGTPSGVDALRNAAPTITVSTTIFSTLTQSTTASTTITQIVSPSITVTTTVSATCANNQLPTNQIATDSLSVKSLKSNKNYSENEKINIPCSGDFTLSLTSNGIDSDLFFGFPDANGIDKDTKFVELQIGLKNGQNTIKDLVTANIKRSNLVKRQGSAKINLVYVNGIYSLLSNGQSFTTFTSSNIAPKSLTITPFDGTVTLSNFLLACM